MKTARIDGLKPEHQHLSWSPRHPSIAEIEPGELVTILVPDSSAGQLSPNSTQDELRHLDYSRVDAAVGPIAVAGAKAGDLLEIELLEIAVGGWGWSGVFRDFGFLRGRFEDDLAIWTLRQGEARVRSGFLLGFRTPVFPMLGVIGVAPSSGEFGMIPPLPHGGNLDNRLLRPGTRLQLPIQIDGANFSIGDPHAAQGDGEVCGTGIEVGAKVRLRVRVIPRRSIPFPRAEVLSDPAPPGPLLLTMGVAPSLESAARAAVENMIDELAQFGFSAKEAYLVQSVIGNLRISELVDMPNYVVSMTVPKDRVSEPRRAPLRSTRPGPRDPPRRRKS